MLKKLVWVLGVAVTFSSGVLGCSHSSIRDRYPAHWWKTYPTAGKPYWEVLPHEAGPGEVILSKRNELGVLSNFSYSPFVFRGQKYLSIEGFWQMMLYPEDGRDPRFKGRYPHTRREVSQMVAFEAKSAGKSAEDQMKELGIDWVSFEGERFPYRSATKGRHYALIREAMCEKLKQNSIVSEILLATDGLKLRPDHHPEPSSPPEWLYFQVWMELRTILVQKQGDGSQLDCASI